MYKVFIEQIKGASKSILCDLVIKNITIIDVFSQDSFLGDVALKNGYIVGIGNYEGKDVIDGSGKYICPGLIDAHVHIESSLTTPKEYSKAALLHGVTTVVADPHEIANVMGIEGINLMLELSRNLPLDFYFMLPSCVPSTSFENSGAILKNEDLKPLYNEKRILGLGEVMDFPSVLNCEEDMISKIKTCLNNDKIIDGHGAGLTIDQLNAYCTANIKTDHECHLKEEVIDRIRRGMYVLIREGTVAKNLKELIKTVNIKNSSRFCFCTDDKHIDDLIKTGTIDSSIRFAINSGLTAPTAIQMGTLNSAQCYNLKNTGAIAPGYKGDFLILDDLNTFKINSVYKNGLLVVSHGVLLDNTPNKSNKIKHKNSINIPAIKKDDFKISTKDKTLLNIIEINPNKLESNHLKVNINSSMKEFVSSTEDDYLKVAVIERHNSTGNIGLGIIKGLKIKDGVIATTIAHDSHNIIVCGTSDEDMLLASESLKKIGGGIVVVHKGRILASIQLEIGGLMTDRPTKDILEDLDKLHSAIKIIAPEIDFNPFLTLSFLSLPVIPDIKITDRGLFNVVDFKFIAVAE